MMCVKKVFILLTLTVLLECAVTRGSNRKRGKAKSRDIKIWKGIGKRTYRRSNCPKETWGSLVENNKA
ncbi:hypothetical protein PM10SUCC1_17800 [Propionigenium maris DSM 9537]|uniref:Uncharacterized protein n=1 Tax=Propionigenium maris DSM 9537 TaxID=1123000 RepID=A0A9W6LMF1_9FUSO|nr:hypothetical protein PM10SUCC1_17800 [Propionigenium maris DSM 9537]